MEIRRKKQIISSEAWDKGSLEDKSLCPDKKVAQHKTGHMPEVKVTKGAFVIV